MHGWTINGDFNRGGYGTGGGDGECSGNGTGENVCELGISDTGRGFGLGCADGVGSLGKEKENL